MEDLLENLHSPNDTIAVSALKEIIVMIKENGIFAFDNPNAIFSGLENCLEETASFESKEISLKIVNHIIIVKAM